MKNEKLNKKLSIFYHPLFQELIEAWSHTFSQNKSNLNMITFIELNLRIQKAIIPVFDFSNSLNSALTDWYKELDDLSIKNTKKYPPQTKLYPIKPNIAPLIESLENLPFEPTATGDKYISFFKTNKNHVSLKYAETQLSLLGFAKFLFDLCVSWCENLDIELFLLFLSGLFLQITEGASIQKSRLLRTESIVCLPLSFLNQMKIFKTHYERYKKQDLSNFQSWYEWNYLPSRLREVTKKVVDTLKPFYPIEDSTRVSNLAEVFESIIRKYNLDVVSSSENFVNQLRFFEQLTFSDNDKSKFGGLEGVMENHILNEGRPESESPEYQLDIEANSKSHLKFTKKLSIPIFGKSITKQQQENKANVHTINNHSLFLENEANESQAEIESLCTGLYPIYEKGELSDCPSNGTLYGFDKKNIGKRGSIHVVGSLSSRKHEESPGKKENPRILEEKDLTVLPEALSKTKLFKTLNSSITKEKGTHSPDVNITNRTLESPHESNELSPKAESIGNITAPVESFVPYNQTTRRDSSIAFEEALEDMRNLTYNDISSLEADKKRQTKFKASFLNKDYDPYNPKPKHKHNTKEPHCVRVHAADKLKEIAGDQYKLDQSRNEPPKDKYSLPFYNRKRILTPSVRSNPNMSNTATSIQSTTASTLNRSPELEALVISTKKKNNNSMTNNTNNDNNIGIGFEKKISSITSSATVTSGLDNKALALRPPRPKTDLPQKFDFSQLEPLFPGGLAQFDIDNIKNYHEYLTKVEEIKQAYNKQYKSEFLKSYELKADFQSSRHELGGAITEKERDEFLKRVAKTYNNRLKRWEEKKKSGVFRAGRRLKSLDNPKMKRAFLHGENKILFKEVLLGGD